MNASFKMDRDKKLKSMGYQFVLCLAVASLVMHCVSNYLNTRQQEQNLTELKERMDQFQSQLEHSRGVKVQPVHQRTKRHVISSSSSSWSSSGIGISGLPGPPGLDGMDGLPGPPGLDGVDGSPGRPGATGPKGDIGLPGTLGLRGEKGEPGRVGSNGLAGPPGLPGQDGNDATTSGAVYNRWGRTTCPSTARLLYSGTSAGTWFKSEAGSSQYLCMPDQAQYPSGSSKGEPYYSKITGVSYQGVSSSAFQKTLHDHVAPCAVCQSSRPVSVMIPARRDCPTGWHEEYRGYLLGESAGFPGHPRTEYVCVDIDAQSGGVVDKSAKQLAAWFHVTVECSTSALRGCTSGSYHSGAELTCVVCSR